LIHVTVSGGVIMCMMALGVRQIQTLTESLHLPVELRADQQMTVLRHQTILSFRKRFDRIQFVEHDLADSRSLLGVGKAL
jgi:hypothetical protein